MAFNALREKMGRQESRREAPALAHKTLKENYIDPLQEKRFKPTKHVWLKSACLLRSRSILADRFSSSDMHDKDTTCLELINETANAIDDDALKLLFVSVQQNNLDICVRFALR